MNDTKTDTHHSVVRPNADGWQVICLTAQCGFRMDTPYKAHADAVAKQHEDQTAFTARYRPLAGVIREAAEAGARAEQQIHERAAAQFLAMNDLSPEDASDRHLYLLSHDIQGNHHTLILARVIDRLEYDIEPPTIKLGDRA